jgi:hypothetical protein
MRRKEMAMKQRSTCTAELWSRLAAGCAFAAAIALPGAALAQAGAPPQPAAESQSAAPATEGCADSPHCRAESRQAQPAPCAAEQSSCEPAVDHRGVREGDAHPYTQDHFQLGAGHRD